MPPDNRELRKGTSAAVLTDDLTRADFDRMMATSWCHYHNGTGRLCGYDGTGAPIPEHRGDHGCSVCGNPKCPDCVREWDRRYGNVR